MPAQLGGPAQLAGPAREQERGLAQLGGPAQLAVPAQLGVREREVHLLARVLAQLALSPPHPTLEILL